MSANRTQLKQKLPLKTPFSLHIFPAYACNFRCIYCIHSKSTDELSNMGFQNQMMSFEVFKLAIDQVAMFDDKLKALIFAGHGEPLIHKDIAKMVSYVKQKDIAERVEIVTNAYFLTNEMSDKLIDAGLDRIKISIQGTSSDVYEKVCGVKINFEKLVRNIEYLYKNKTHTDVYIKIIDVALKDDEDKSLFMRTFAPIADEAAIEYSIPFVNDLNFKDGDFEKSKQGHGVCEAKVCAMPFYMLVLLPNGDVVPCCSTEIPITLGNVSKTTIYSIWHGQKINCFLNLQLKDRMLNKACNHCAVPSYGLQEGDYLDDCIDELKEKYEKWRN